MEGRLPSRGLIAYRPARAALGGTEAECPTCAEMRHRPSLRGHAAIAPYALGMVRKNDQPIPPRLPSELLSQREMRLTGETDLYRLRFEGEFSGAQGAGITIEESHIARASFVGADLGRLRLVDVLVEESNFSGADMQEASFTRVTFRGCRMSGALMPHTYLQDVVFSECKLDGVNFRMSKGDRVVFDHVNLRQAELISAHLKSTCFFDCDMQETDVSQAVLPAARFHGSVLSDIKGGEYLRDVVIDSSQVLPLASRVFSAFNIRVQDERNAPPS